jgi:hypothetical protein
MTLAEMYDEVAAENGRLKAELEALRERVRRAEEAEKASSRAYADLISLHESSVGKWLSAALGDPAVCDEMKCDIRSWLDAAHPE